MEIVADLHLHSKYSRAVSQQMVISEMARWAKIKGIDLLGTGDFTHPIWFRELQAVLEETAEGIYGIKKDKENPPSPPAGPVPERYRAGGFGRASTKFILTTEISSIYLQGGRTRKIHNLVIAPSFAVAEKINQELVGRGANLMADGRPIIGMSAKDLASLVFGVDRSCLVIPAHIWTPHFSLFGSESGFDALEECFGELTGFILAAETGLSSDPAMNWRVEDLDDKSIVSFSDAHSPANLGRECTVLEMSAETWGYQELRQALLGKISHTIEFYPEEGKYHYTGHRNCGVVFSPEETKKKGTTCPVCGKRLTVGVMERVEKLGVRDKPARNASPACKRLAMSGRHSDAGGVRVREKDDEWGNKWIETDNRPPFIKLVPLREILAEVQGAGKLTQGVAVEYERLTKALGNELTILINKKAEEIAAIGGEKLAEGIMKVRAGDIFIRPGFDGEYGKVKVWGDEGVGGEGEDERETSGEQMGLF